MTPLHRILTLVTAGGLSFLAAPAAVAQAPATARRPAATAPARPAPPAAAKPTASAPARAKAAKPRAATAPKPRGSKAVPAPAPPGRTVRKTTRRRAAGDRPVLAPARRWKAYHSHVRSEVRRVHTPPKLRAWHLRVQLRATNLLVRHRSLNVFKDDDLLARTNVTAGAEFKIARGLWIGVEVGYAGGRFDDDLFDTWNTELILDSLQLGATIGYQLWGWFTPYARLGFTGTWVQGYLNDSGGHLGGKAFGAGVYAVGGIEISLSRGYLARRTRGDHFTLGLSIEAGWVHLGKVQLGGGLSEDLLVDDHQSGIGSLTLAGPTINVGLLLGF